MVSNLHCSLTFTWFALCLHFVYALSARVWVGKFRTCGPANLDLCSDEVKKKIEGYMVPWISVILLQ